MKNLSNFKNFRLQAFLSKQANEVMTLHPVKKEWRMVIILLGISKLLTMLVSVLAGYHFILSRFSATLPETSKIIIVVGSIIFLAVIELLNSYLMVKLFKFFFRNRTIQGLGLVLPVVAIYAVSFIISTNGLAERQANKKDLTVEIIETENNAKEQIESKYLAYTEDLNKQIKQIEKNPQGWSNGKREFLTAKQLKSIEVLNSKKDQIKVEEKTELQILEAQTLNKVSKNKAEKEKTASDYYLIMVVIMLVQLFSNAGITFFYWRIRTQENANLVESEDMQELTEVAQDQATNIVMAVIVEKFNNFTDHINKNLTAKQYLDVEVVKPLSNNSAPVKEPQFEQKQVFGFGKKSAVNSAEKTAEKTAENDPLKTPEASSRLSSQRNFMTVEKTNKIDLNLEYLKKHKLLVKAIYKVQPKIEQKLSNAQIKNVQEIAKKAKIKSRTTVQKIHSILQTIDNETQNILKK